MIHMEEKKDFLDQFSNTNKPESFQEEKRVPVQKKKFEPNWKVLGIFSLVFTLLLGLLYFFFFAPKIVVPNFVGVPKAEVATWIRQQSIDGSGIVMRDEFSLEHPADTVISQSVTEGSKVGKNAKISFVVSKGADPSEVISLPDISSMKRDEINEWINANKLSKTKISAVYSSSVPEGQVISYDLKSEDGTFKRGTNLVITISKGIEPSKKVMVEDFAGKSESDFLSWANKNKLTVKKETEFSSSAKPGDITRTFPAKGENMESGSLITYYVSEGKGISVPNFTTMSKAEVEAYKRVNANKLILSDSEGRYSNQKGYVIAQTPAAGSMVREGEQITLTINLGNQFYLSTEQVQLVGNKLDVLVNQLNNLRSKGIDAYADNWTAGEAVYSTEHTRGTIISAQCTSRSTNQRYACDGPLPLDARFDVVVSKGLTWEISAMKEVGDEVNKRLETKTISDLMNEMFAKKGTFKLDPSITAQDYDQAGAIYLNGQKVTQIYEDQEYVIRKAQ